MVRKLKQKEILLPFSDQWEFLSTERQKYLAQGALRYVEMDAEQRAAAESRFRVWQDLSENERDTIRNQYRQFQNLLPREKERIRDNFQRFQQLPLDRRQQLRDRFRRMDTDQRQKIR